MSSVPKIRRLLKLVEELQSGRPSNSRDLAERCGVSRRTIFRDLRILQDSGLPVFYDQQRQGYWMSPSTYLPPTDLTLPETLSLLILAHSAGRKGSGLPLLHAAHEAGQKLFANLPSHFRTHVGELADLVEVRVSQRNPLGGAESHYAKFLQAIAGRRRIRIRYDSLAERKQIRTLLSPYRMFFARRSWYVIGRSSLHRAVRTFHVGRVRESELTEDSYEIPLRFSLSRYLGNAWHLIRERGQRRDVVIRFQPLVAQNVAEVTWHKTQRVVWNDDRTLDFHVTVDGLHEISWWILGYGDQAEVLGPPELRNLIAERIKRMGALYGIPAKQTSRRKRTRRKS